MSDVFPVAQMLAAGVPAFFAGVLVGAYCERHRTYGKESTMRTVANAYRTWYERTAPVVVTIVAILALIGIWIGAAATITNGQQDARDDARDSAVQRCFDDWAIAQSASSQAVREASIVKDEATKVFNQALNDEGQAFKALVESLRKRTLAPAQVERLDRTLAHRNRAGRAVERAQAELDKARQENPVPEAPSSFCSVKP